MFKPTALPALFTGKKAAPTLEPDAWLATLQCAIRLAKDEQIQTVAVLRTRLTQIGYTPDQVQQALVHWANYEAKKTQENQ